jgi:phosphatidylinositol alpha 1,6-mannosyltransferase
VAVVSESFLPQINGVTGSVCRVLEHLERRGHDAILIAPSGSSAEPGPSTWAGFPVYRSPSAPLPTYPGIRVGTPWARMASILRAYRPDVIHIAGPAVLGAQAARVAARLRIPSVAVFQTDFAGFAVRYGFSSAERAVWRWMTHIHMQVDRTLAPSSASAAALERRGIPGVERWARGVDLTAFHPRHRSPRLRRQLAPGGELLVGYVGRLAPEKRVHLLAEAAQLPGVRTVVVGDGPSRSGLERRLPTTEFTGFRTGRELSELVASLDVFVHPGVDETFCQAVQEAKAAGVAVIAPAAGGPLDLIQHGVSGLHVPADGADPAGDIRAAVEQLAGDATLRRRLARNARRSVLGRDWDTVCDELVGHYRAVCGLPADVASRLRAA